MTQQQKYSVMDHIARGAGLVLAAIPVLVLGFVYFWLAKEMGEHIRGYLQIMAVVIFCCVQYLGIAAFFLFKNHPVGYWMLLVSLGFWMLVAGLGVCVGFDDSVDIILMILYFLLCLIEMPLLVLAMLNTYAVRRKAAGEATAGVPESGKPATVDNIDQEPI